jgi:hypothetical protein
MAEIKEQFQTSGEGSIPQTILPGGRSLSFPTLKVEALTTKAEWTGPGASCLEGNVIGAPVNVRLTAKFNLNAPVLEVSFQYLAEGHLPGDKPFTVFEATYFDEANQELGRKSQMSIESVDTSCYVFPSGRFERKIKYIHVVSPSSNITAVSTFTMTL